MKKKHHKKQKQIQSQPKYNWFGTVASPLKRSKAPLISFLGLPPLKKQPKKTSSGVNFLGGANPSFSIKPSSLFIKERITTKKKRLSKWGDADMDGSPNWFDCDASNWAKDAENPVMSDTKGGVIGPQDKPVIKKRNIFERTKAWGKKQLPTKEGFDPKGAQEERDLTRLGELQQKKERQKQDIAEVKSKKAEILRIESEGGIVPAEEKKALDKKLKTQSKFEKELAKRQTVEELYAKTREAFGLGGPLGVQRAKEIAIEARLAAGKQATQKQIVALMAAEKKTALWGKEGRARRLAKAIPGIAQAEGVLGVVSGYGLGVGGHYTKEMRAKSARVRRLTQVAAGQVFGAGLTSIPSSSEPRGRGRPAGPSGEYKIGGKPVYEDDFRQWEIKQKSLNRMLPSNVQSQSLNPEYIEYMKQQQAQKEMEGKMKQMQQQNTQQQSNLSPGERLQQTYQNQDGEDMSMDMGQENVEGVDMPIPSDQAPQTEGMTNEAVQAIAEARRRTYVRSSQDEIKIAQHTAQQQDQILKAPNFMKGELKAAGGGMLSPVGPQIMDAPNAFTGEMRNINKNASDLGEVRLSERPQTNPFSETYLEIELGSGKPVIRHRPREKWMDGSAL